MHLRHPSASFRVALLLGILPGLGALAAAPLAAQTGKNARAITTDTELLKEPGGTALARLGKSTPVTTGTTKGTWIEASIDGWIVGNALRDDKRDGFDVAVNLAVGTPIRAVQGGGATLGLARAGALFNRVEVKSGWVHVRRTGWVPKTSVGAAVTEKARAATPPPPPRAATPTTTSPPTQPSASRGSSVTIAAGATLSAQPNGPPIGSFETGVGAEVVEHRAGWSRVRVEAWVRDAAIGVANSGGISGADIRAEPDRYIGQSVDWTLQVIAVQKADELRPELPLGQPYVLARGPLPETGFVYLTVGAEDADKFRVLPPLARVQVRATIRAGKTRFLSTPVLTFVRRLD